MMWILPLPGLLVPSALIYILCLWPIAYYAIDHFDDLKNALVGARDEVESRVRHILGSKGSSWTLRSCRKHARAGTDA